MIAGWRLWPSGWCRVPDGVKFTIEGFEGLQRELKAVGNDAPKVIRAGMRAGATVVKKRAQSNLSGHRDTGKLADTLKISTRINRANRSVVSTVRNTRDTFYGMFLEFGTVKQSPVRWLSRAVRERPRETYKGVADRMRVRLRKIKAKTKK